MIYSSTEIFRNSSRKPSGNSPRTPGNFVSPERETHTESRGWFSLFDHRSLLQLVHDLVCSGFRCRGSLLFPRRPSTISLLSLLSLLRHLIWHLQAPLLSTPRHCRCHHADRESSLCVWRSIVIALGFRLRAGTGVSSILLATSTRFSNIFQDLQGCRDLPWYLVNLWSSNFLVCP